MAHNVIFALLSPIQQATIFTEINTGLGEDNAYTSICEMYSNLPLMRMLLSKSPAYNIFAGEAKTRAILRANKYTSMHSRNYALAYVDFLFNSALYPSAKDVTIDSARKIRDRIVVSINNTRASKPINKLSIKKG
jgi:hypothetical protein